MLNHYNSDLNCIILSNLIFIKVKSFVGYTVTYIVSDLNMLS